MMPGSNGGTLRRGSLPGNTPGTGRPSNELRGSMREILGEGLPSLLDYVKGEKGKPADTLKAIDIAAKYGLNDKVDEDFVREMAAVVGEVLKSVPNGDDLLNQIYEAWKPVIAKRL